MRKVKCSRAKSACFLEPISTPQYGKGGLIPVNTEFVIPFRSGNIKKKCQGEESFLEEESVK